MTEIQDPVLRPQVTALMRTLDGTDEHAFVLEAIRERARLRKDVLEIGRERIRLAESLNEVIAKNPGKLGNRIGKLEKALAAANERASTAERAHSLSEAIRRDDAEQARDLAAQQHRAIKQIHDRVEAAMKAMLRDGLPTDAPARLEAATHLATIQDAMDAYERRYPNAKTRR